MDSVNPFEIVEEETDENLKKELSLPIRDSFKVKKKSEIGSPTSVSNMPCSFENMYETNRVPLDEEIYSGKKIMINKVNLNKIVKILFT